MDWRCFWKRSNLQLKQEYLHEKIHRGSSAADGFSFTKTSDTLRERKTDTMELQEKKKALLARIDEITKQDLCLAFSGLSLIHI